MEKIKTLILKSFDFELSEKEQTELDNALENSIELQKYQSEMLSMREELKSLKSYFPTPDMSNKILDMLQPLNKVNQAMIYSMEKIFKRLSYVAAILLFFMFAYNAYKADELTISSIVGIQQISLEQEFEDAIASID